MKKKNLEKELSRSLLSPAVTINEKHFRDTCLLAEKEACLKQKRARISFISFLFMQIRFIGFKIWSVQVIFLLFVSGMFNRLYGVDSSETPLSTARLLFCLSILVLMTALPFLYRSVRYRMQEIEAAARFSCVKLLMAKLAMVGIGDLFILSGIFCITIWKTSLQADSALLYLCFPFLLAGSGCLFILGHFTPKQFFTGSMGLCSFLILAASILFRHSTMLFCRSFSAGWIAACIFLAAFCGWQFRYILYRSSYTEMQII